MIAQSVTKLPSLSDARARSRGKYADIFAALETNPGVWHLLSPTDGDPERVETRRRHLLAAAHHYQVEVDTAVRGLDLYASSPERTRG